MPTPPRLDKPTRIFISYRREDSQTITGRIDEWLVERIPRENVFIDIDSVEYGDNFVSRIAETILQCQAMLVVIGPHWLNESGELSHYVQSEIEQALRSQRQIIPVLVEGASLPPAERLPESVRSLVYLNAALVRSGRDFQRDMEDVAKTLNIPVHQRGGRSEPSDTGRHISRRLLLVGTASAAVVIALGVGAQRWYASLSPSHPTRTPVYPYTPGSVLYAFERTSGYLYALNAHDGTVRWKRGPEAEFTVFAPLVEGTTVYLGTASGMLYALDGDKGTLRWQQSIPGVAIQSALVAAGALYVNSAPRPGSPNVLPTLYAFAADNGALRWQASNFAAALAQGALYGFTSQRATINGFTQDTIVGLSALDLDNGRPRWSYALNPPSVTSAYNSQLVLGATTIYLASDIASLDSPETSALYAIDTQSGALKWTAPTTGKEALLVATEQSVFVSAQLAAAEVLALSTAGGTPRWRFPIVPGVPDELGEPSMVAVAGESVLFAADGVYELDGQTGTVQSHYLNGLGIDASQPLIVGDMLYVTSPGFNQSSYALTSDATVYAVSRQTTDRPLKWKLQLSGGTVGNLTRVGETLIFTSGGEGLYAVDSATGVVRWRFKSSGSSDFTAPVPGPQA